MRIFIALISLIFNVSVTAQVFVNSFTDLENIDFGFCDMAMGITVFVSECAYMSGCSWEDGVVNYSPALYTSFDSCEEGCLQKEEYQDLAGMDFGECIAVLGIANVSESCVPVSGCSTYFNGIDYSYTFYDSFEECYESCFEIGEGCTYSVALNYKPNATIHDGSCLFMNAYQGLWVM